jgi:hypothetical protein
MAMRRASSASANLRRLTRLVLSSAKLRLINKRQLQLRMAISLVLKRQRDPGAERSNLPIVHFHIHLRDFRHAQVTREPAAVSTASRPASSHDFSLTPTTSIMR